MKGIQPLTDFADFMDSALLQNLRIFGSVALNGLYSNDDSALGHVTVVHTLDEHINFFYNFCNQITMLTRTMLLRKLVIGLETGASPGTNTPVMELRYAVRLGYKPWKNTQLRSVLW